MANEEKIIPKVRITNKYDTYSNWDQSSLVLRAGEIGFSSDIDPQRKVAMMYVGNGTSKVSELAEGEGTSTTPIDERSQSHAIFYSGIGAGYSLPEASTTALGGIKINDKYFQMLNEQFLPVTYQANSQTFELLGERDLYVHGNIIADNIAYQYTDTYSVGAKFIDVHAGKESSERVVTRTQGYGFDSTEQYYNITIDGIAYHYYSRRETISTAATNVKIFLANEGKSELVSYNDQTGEVVFIIYIPATSEDSRIYGSIIYEVLEEGGAVVDPDPLGTDEYSGVLMHNYTDGSPRPVAMIGVDSSGILRFTDTYTEEGTGYNRVLHVPNNVANGIVTYNNGACSTTTDISGTGVTVAALSFFDGDGGLMETYNGSSTKSVTVPTTWATKVIANNTEYTVDANHTITLGTSQWTDEMNERFNDGMDFIEGAEGRIDDLETNQVDGITIKVNNTDESLSFADGVWSGTVNTLTDVQSSDDTLTITPTTFDIVHSTPTGASAISLPLTSASTKIEESTTTTFFLPTSLATDKNGHITSFQGQNTDLSIFKTIASTISGMSSAIATLQGQVASLQQSIATEAQLYTELEKRVAALEAKH